MEAEGRREGESKGGSAEVVLRREGKWS